jgi:putative permease
MNYLIFLATYLIIQALDGNVLFPLLIGREVNLHPVLIVLAILIFGGIWGFWGNQRDGKSSEYPHPIDY